MSSSDEASVIRVIQQIVNAPNLQLWDDFLSNASEEAAKAPTPVGSQFSIRERELHIEFEQHFEHTINEACRKAGLNVDSFYSSLSNPDASTLITTFNAVVTLATEFEAFIDVVHSREKRSYFFHVLKGYALEFDQLRK